MQRAILIGALAGVAFCAGSTVRARDLPAWIYATPGTRALLGTDGEDAPTAIVCNSPAAYKAQTEGACFRRKEGTVVVIDAIAPQGANYNQLHTLLRVHAENGSWHGYADIGAVYPMIPPSTVLTLKPVDSQRATLANQRAVNPDGGTDLEKSATVKVVAFDPTYEDRDLLVTVLSGTHAGMRGWTYAVQTVVGGREANVSLCPKEMKV